VVTVVEYIPPPTTDGGTTGTVTCVYIDAINYYRGRTAGTGRRMAECCAICFRPSGIYMGSVGKLLLAIYFSIN
jgi:hypothetical protein